MARLTIPTAQLAAVDRTVRNLVRTARQLALAAAASVLLIALLLWRLRGPVGTFRDVAGTALTFRVFTPGFLGATAVAAFACLVLVGVGLVALVVLALG